jgi:hypothetical protein
MAGELSLQDGIEAARMVLPRCYFDESACYDGIDHLRGYMREWDEKTQTFRNRPKHDQHSHAADAFRYMALSVRKTLPREAESSRIMRRQGVSQGVNYAFSLDDIWDCAPKQTTRVG